jgi:putative thiamine transport system permease protein
VALAVGFSVSVAQYLPTLVIGAGRLPTLTTEALGLALGGDRRLAAVAALLLAALPLLALAAALAVRSPRLGRHERQGD